MEIGIGIELHTKPGAEILFGDLGTSSRPSRRSLKVMAVFSETLKPCRRGRSSRACRNSFRSDPAGSCAANQGASIASAAAKSRATIALAISLELDDSRWGEW
jgi:hypothetical protein